MFCKKLYTKSKIIIVGTFILINPRNFKPMKFPAIYTALALGLRQYIINIHLAGWYNIYIYYGIFLTLLKVLVLDA